MNDLKKNGSGYYDPVAYSAMRSYKGDNAGMQVYRGDIFYLTGSYGEVVGSEQNESRPCVIVSNDVGNKHSNIVEIVLLSTKNKHNLPTHCTVLAKIPSIAICEQIKSVSKARLGEWIRKCTDEEMAAIDKCLAISIGLGQTPDPKETVENSMIDDLKMKLEGAERELDEKNELMEKAKVQLEKTMASFESEKMITDSLKKELAEVANERDKAKKERDILRKEWNEMRAAKESDKNEDLIKITAQMDLYKALYDQLIEKITS